MTETRTVTFGLPTATLTATNTADRTVHGLALPYGEPGRTTLGVLTCRAGAVPVPADLSRVKLFTEHGRAVPVGYATVADDTPAGMVLTFRLAATPAGDAALLEATEHVRDALSVELSDVDIVGGVIVAGRLDAVALTALPAYPSARLAAALDPQEEPTMTTSTLEAAPALAATVSPETAAPALTAAPAPVVVFAAPAPTRATARTVSRLDAAAVIARALTGARDASQVNAALTDIVPADDAGAGYIRPQWVDELWTPRLAEQFLVNAVNHAPLTGSPVKGWRWKTYPQVGPYAGNKAAIPSNKAETEPAEEAIYRLAGGWDTDRIFTDFNTGFVDSLLSAASFDLALKVEAAVGAAILADAPAVVPAGYGPIAAIVAAAAAVLGNGAPVTFIGVAPDVFAAMLSITTADAPAWLAGSLSIATGTGNLGQLEFGMSTGLPVGGVVAGNRNALTHYDTPTINVQAVNIPNGGIDVALFYYGADMTHSAKGLAKATMTTAPVIP